ncbi:hypothetical protein, partial [Peribacillus sp. CSMR9]|uniref:hypothetical protein n=1 Tax=Peribacillus sp. CSMR9 TaxID=2981350 RepID=UPI002952BC76
LTTTTAFMVRDFHPIDCTHAGRTKKVAAATSLIEVKHPIKVNRFKNKRHKKEKLPRNLESWLLFL